MLKGRAASEKGNLLLFFNGEKLDDFIQFCYGSTTTLWSFLVSSFQVPQDLLRPNVAVVGSLG